METVSIIVPIYNAEKHIRRCIFSLLHQTHTNIEIILINDGSDDQSGAICDNYAAKFENIRVFHQANAGPASARNLGLEQASGNFIQFVDADDTIKPLMTQKLVEAMMTGDDLAICGFEATKRTFTPSLTGRLPRTTFLQHIGKLYSELILPSLCNKMYRNNTIKKYNLRLLEGCSFGEDLLFNLDYLQVCENIQISPEVFYEYHRTENSVTNNYMTEMFMNHKQLHKRMLSFLKDNHCYTARNKHHVNMIFANGIIHSLTNLFHEKSDLTKAERTKNLTQIMHDKTVTKQLPYFTNNIQAKIIGTLIKKGRYNGTYVFLRSKELVRNHIQPLFHLLQKWNRTGY